MRSVFVVAALALTAPAAAAAAPVEVVATLEQPSLARAVAGSRALAPAVSRRRLDLASPTSVAYLTQVERDQRAVAARIRRAIPSARLRWRYRVVVNGLAVVLPATQVPRLARIPGVARVYGSSVYRSRLDRTPAQVGAPALWGPSLATAGAGIKIGIIDDGIDQRHVFFDPTGYAMPPGFPKGNRSFTTPKVIVARAFPPASPRWTNASRPFDPRHSGHATHVAGIAAGNNATRGPGGRALSGVAPRAYLGNYKVLTIPTVSGVGLDGNAPEIAAGIEAAVRDGMDVINLSLGEPEIEPSRDIVVRAIDGAADAGVVPVVAAGNDFASFGRGTIGSPGSAAKAVTVGAVTDAGAPARFSSAAPTPISLRLKPELSAPGTEVLSSIPGNEWAALSGTSMAAPHVAGGAALLRQRHPEWSVAQIKSALVLTATGGSDPARVGAGVMNLPRAAEPLVFAEPTAVSFGLLRPGETARRTVLLTDAGGRGGQWSVTFRGRTTTGSLPWRVTLELEAPPREGEYSEHVLVRQGTDVRRIPVWFRVAVARLAPPRRTLARTGTYRGSNRGHPMRVADYRYPEGGSRRLLGPEEVFRVRIRRPVANFGVAVLRGRVEARIVFAGNENRLTGYGALPFNLNPYLREFLRPTPIAAALRPAAGDYDVVFDSRSRGDAGPYRFRFWIGDTTPPAARLVSRRARRGIVSVRVRDTGAGVDPATLHASVDGSPRRVRYRNGVVRVFVGPLRRGTHTLRLQVSDRQEAKNNENVPRILPNTRVLRVRFSAP